MVAVSGPPASGKSTLANKLSNQINNLADLNCSEVIPMDGYHLDNDALDRLELRHRKGSINTFDSNGFVDMIKTLHMTNDEIKIPLFNREIDAVVPNAKVVSPQHKILIIEGNYLLVNSDPWLQLHTIYDHTIFINPGIETLRNRLIQRWLDNNHDLESAKIRALSNDIPNAELVLEHSIKADLTID